MDQEEPDIDKILNANDVDEASIQMLKLFAEGKVLKDILEISDASLSERYEYGRELFEKKEFVEAAQVFGHLLTLNPMNKSYWIAMAYSKIQNDELETALAALSVVSLLDPEDAESYFNAGLCYVSLEERDEALASFQLAAEAAKKEHRYRDIEEKANHWIGELE